MPTPSLAFLSSLPLRPYGRPLHPRTCRTRSARARPLCVAQEKAHSASSPIPSNDSSSSGSSDEPAPTSPLTPPVSSAEERKERAHAARMKAERLELVAEKARLEFERAQIQAERKRLELDKAKSMRESQKSSPHSPESKAPENPYDKPKSNQIADIKVTTSQGKTSPLTAGTLSELLNAEFPRVSESDIEIIKDKLCGMNTYFVTEVDRSPFDERVVFRGNIRQSPEQLLEELEKLAEKEGISKRVRLFLLFDPKEEGDGDEKRPVLVALPARAIPNQPSSFSTIFSGVLGVGALVTTFSYGIGVFGLNPEIISQIAKGSLEDSILTLPVSAGAVALALLHEAGHRVVAAMRNVKLGLPFFLPSLQIGTYGTITPLESYPRLRKDLFDVAAAGPIAGLVGSFVALIAGLVITSGGDVAEWFPKVPSALFHASILVGALADTILPAGIREQTTIALHPLAMVGYSGLLVNALNLMPIGRLDGGRIVQALYGRAVAGRVTALTLILQGLGSLAGNSPLLLFWGLLCVFLQRESDIPCQNEVIEPDNTRTAIGLGALCIMLLILVPFPDQIGDILGRL